jgi:hypothetical protein
MLRLHGRTRAEVADVLLGGMLASSVELDRAAFRRACVHLATTGLPSTAVGDDTTAAGAAGGSAGNNRGAAPSAGRLPGPMGLMLRSSSTGSANNAAASATAEQIWTDPAFRAMVDRLFDAFDRRGVGSLTQDDVLDGVLRLLPGPSQPAVPPSPWGADGATAMKRQYSVRMDAV